MKQIQYQQKAVDALVNKTIDLLTNRGRRQTFIFKAPTGSGKTVMLSEMLVRLNQELGERPDAPFTEAAYIWIAPNKLHEQSYFKLKNYFTESNSLRTLKFDEIDHSADNYIKPGEILFVNWESVNKDNNIMVRETENSASLYDITRRTQEENGIPIIIIIDEEHKMASSSAKKAEKVLENISAKVEIRVSATPDTDRNFQAFYEVLRDHVIEEEMIKESIVLNPALDFKDPRGSLNQHLIWLALQKREELAKAYENLGVEINPLLLIQLPNDGETTTAEDKKVKDEVIETLNTYGINTENGKLAIWLSGEKTDNLDVIDRPNNPTEVLLFKQAIALGWDCPRAAVLLIFRKIGSFQFTAQVVGRILRMPEQKYYTDPRLNKGYVFTNLSQDIISIYKEDIDYFAKNVRATIRDGINNIVLDSEYSERLSTDSNRLGSDFKNVLRRTFISEWNLVSVQASDFTENMLFSNDNQISNGYVDIRNRAYENRKIVIALQNINFDVQNISTDIAKDLEMTGEIGTKIVESKASYVNNIDDLTAMYLTFCKRILGNEYEQLSVKTFGGALKEVMKELFEVSDYETMKIVLCDELPYHNRQKFEHLLEKAVLDYSEILQIRKNEAKQRAFRPWRWELPAVRDYSLDAYDERPDVKDHALEPFMEKKTSETPEKNFVKFLEENSNAIEWWYKNGDSGKAHYAIGYTKSSGERSLFFVDFIIRMKSGDIFIFDTKKGQRDENVVEKHNALIEYVNRPKNIEKRLHGGIIVQDRFGNWVYPQEPISNASELNNPSGWTLFDPQAYRDTRH